MGLFTNYLKWDLFVIYMLTCVIFLGSCCVWVSCMFLFYPAKNQNELKKTKELPFPDEGKNHGGGRSNSINTFQKIENPKAPKDLKSVRSKSINVDSFPSSFYTSSENALGTFSFRAVIEPLPNSGLKEKGPEAKSPIKKKDLSQHSDKQIITLAKNTNESGEKENI